MRHVKRYQELFEAQTELTEKQTGWLDECTNGKWTLNPQTGLVDIRGDFNFYSQLLRNFKGVRFGVVTGDFKFAWNILTSLEGAPQEVGGDFVCAFNNIASLEGAPQKVGGNFSSRSNRLNSLKGAPQEVGGRRWEEVSIAVVTISPL
jgi:hypothetical protein